MAKQLLNSQRFLGLELLSTSLLEEIIRTDFNEDTDYDLEMIQYVLEVIAKRKKEEQPDAVPDVQASWKNLQLRRASAEANSALPRTDSSPKHKKSFHSSKRAFRYVAIVAACIAVIFAVMISAQAMGADVFGVLARWTDSTFRFKVAECAATDATTASDSANNAHSEALASIGIPADLAPTQLPPDCTLALIEPYETISEKGVQAAYFLPGLTHYLTIDVCEFANSTSLNYIYYEKSSADPVCYVHNGMTFYIFQNCSTYTATWTDTKYCITIAGANSKDIIISIIDSIKEVPHE